MLAAIRAASAGHGLYDLDLFAGTGVLDKMADVDDALEAGVGGLQAFVLKSQYSRPKTSSVEVNPNRFKELRTARGLSIRRLAAEAGVSTETIYSLEHGRRDFIWPKTARKLAQALEADLAELVE